MPQPKQYWHVTSVHNGYRCHTFYHEPENAMTLRRILADLCGHAIDQHVEEASDYGQKELSADRERRIRNQFLADLVAEEKKTGGVTINDDQENREEIDSIRCTAITKEDYDFAIRLGF